VEEDEDDVDVELDDELVDDEEVDDVGTCVVWVVVVDGTVVEVVLDVLVLVEGGTVVVVPGPHGSGSLPTGGTTVVLLLGGRVVVVEDVVLDVDVVVVGHGRVVEVVVDVDVVVDRGRVVEVVVVAGRSRPGVVPRGGVVVLAGGFGGLGRLTGGLVAGSSKEGGRTSLRPSS
jgi:hypothetical protein